MPTVLHLDGPKVEALVDAALKLADIHDETVDGEWGVGKGDTRTDESNAVRAAAADLRGKES
jgi:hypothetical protein